jgi:hypothetical protein
MHAFSFSLLELSYRLPSLPTKKLVRMRMNRQKEQSDRCYVFLKRWTVEGQERWRAAYTKNHVKEECPVVMYFYCQFA